MILKNKEENINGTENKQWRKPKERKKEWKKVSLDMLLNESQVRTW